MAASTVEPTITTIRPMHTTRTHILVVCCFLDVDIFIFLSSQFVA